MPRCNKCGADIMWVQTPDKKWMPVDEGLVPYWNIGKRDINLVTNSGEVIARCSTGEGKPNGYARSPHWATCPNAGAFKTKKDDEGV